MGKISRFTFSSNLKSALLYSDAGCHYLNIATGEITSVRELTGCEGNFYVSFVSNELLSLIWVDDDIPQEWYADCSVFDLTDGSLRTVYTDELYGWLSDAGGMEDFGRVHLHHHDDGLCIVDCTDSSHTATGIFDYSLIDPCTFDTIIVRCYGDSIVRLVNLDGSITPVFSRP